MPLCYNSTCIKDATQILDGECLCDGHFIKAKVEKRLQRKIAINSEISLAFCSWVQDTEVFDMFANHLNKGLKLEELDVNAPKVLKAKA